MNWLCSGGMNIVHMPVGRQNCTRQGAVICRLLAASGACRAQQPFVALRFPEKCLSLTH